MNIKDQFPIFTEYPELIFLDNASTTQKPQKVIQSLSDFYTKYNANVHRGLYPISEKATELFEESRVKIAKFINAEPDEIIFTAGTTDGLNALADSLYRSKMISDKPKILISEAEHHSNILPWQRLPDVELEYLETLIEGLEGLSIPSLRNDYDVISLSAISNVTGQLNPLVEIAGEKNSGYLVADLAQAVGHTRVDVKALGIDFAVFSGHKMYGPMGIGILWGKREHLQRMQPFRVGGGMIREVTRKGATWSESPNRFEAGTPSVADAYALGAAVDFINSIGFSKIEKHEESLRKYLFTNLKKVEAITIYHPDLNQKASGVVSLSFDKAHPHDIAQFLGDNNICTRAGHHCTQILHREVLHIPASLRISLAIYNSKEDIDKLIEKLKEGMQIYER